MSNARKTDQPLSVSEAKNRMSELVKAAQKAPQRIQVSGEPAGAIIGEKDLQLLLELKRQRRAKLLRDFMKAAEEEGIYSEDFGELRGPVKDVDIK
jgi:prevent-host-death family protein